MPKLSRLLRYARCILPSIAVLAGASQAWAQDQEAADSGNKAGWTLSYLLVVLAVALGLIVILRPGSRGRKKSEE